MHRLLPYLTILVLFSLNELQGKSGLYVHGPGLYLHDGAQLSVQGDVHLQDAAIKGSGKVLLCGTSPQSVHAFQSEVGQLSVDNPTMVALYGELRVSTMLSVQRGVLDVRAGRLILEKDEGLECTPGAKLLRNLPLMVFPPAPPLGANLPRLLSAAGLPVGGHSEGREGPLWHLWGRPKGCATASDIALSVPDPPPRRCQVETDRAEGEP